MDKCLAFALIWILQGMCRAQISKDATTTTTTVTPSTTIIPLPTPTEAGTTQTPTVTTVAPSTVCNVDPCQNGALCSLVSGKVTCTCLNGYHGEFCQSKTRTFIVATKFTRGLFGDKTFLTVTSNSPLTNRNSAEFLGLCAVLEALIKASLRRPLRIHCIAFRAGSIIADYAIELESNTNETSTTITKSINEGLVNASFAPKSGNNQLVASNETASVIVDDYNECSGNITGYCDASATCKDTTGSFECACETGKNLVGNKCVSPTTTESNEMIAIYITIGVLAGLLFLLLLLVLIVALRRRRGQDTFRNPPSAPFLPPGLRAQATLPGRDEIDWELYRSTMQ